jgi:hypothetical protein
MDYNPYFFNHFLTHPMNWPDLIELDWISCESLFLVPAQTSQMIE